MGAEPDLVIGRVKWLFTVIASGEVLGEGDREVFLSNVRIRTSRNNRRERRRIELIGEVGARVHEREGGHDRAHFTEIYSTANGLLDEEIRANPTCDWDEYVGPTLYQKFVRLTKDFAVSGSFYSDTRNTLGFGFEYISENAYDSDFLVERDEPGIAMSGRTPNRVYFEVGPTPNGSEILYTRAENDLTYKVHHRPPGDLWNPLWLATVFTGSEIKWPSLVDGEVVPNQRPTK